MIHPEQTIVRTSVSLPLYSLLIMPKQDCARKLIMAHLVSSMSTLEAMVPSTDCTM